MKLWEEFKSEVGVVGVAGEYPDVMLGDGVPIRDEFKDPYGWVKFIGRPERVPSHLNGVVPV